MNASRRQHRAIVSARPKDSVASWERAHTARPGDAEVCARLGLALSRTGRSRDALALLGPALLRHPGHSGLLTSMGAALLGLHRPGEAVGALLLSLEARPDNPMTLSALSVAFLKLGDVAQALPYATAAFRIAPGHDNALNLSRVLLEAGEYDRALDAASQASEAQPASVHALNNQALALEGLARFDRAAAVWRRATRLAPGDTDLRHSLATLLLKLGRLEPATWALYEARLNSPTLSRNLRRWTGEDVAGKTVLLHAEQGLGDTLQFVRYAPFVAERGARVILAVQPSLLRLLAGTPGVAQLVPVGAALPPFDLFCPLLSLPAIFQTGMATIPSPLAYQLPQAARLPGPPRVGLVWAGNPDFRNDRQRSLPLPVLARLTGMPGIEFRSLQFGMGAEAARLGIGDAMRTVSDFSDTARQVAELDLVISADTAVAHLAATMGKPVWLLSRAQGCWRWFLHRADSPWYSSMRIIRQQRANDWETVITGIGEDLRRLWPE